VLTSELYLVAPHPQLALSIGWSIVAIGLCATGFRLRSHRLRMIGLALFAATALKLVVVDLGALDQVYRVLSFLAVGLLMIGASWLYHRAQLTARRAAAR
jgi:uncharacterized membrane protein